MYDLHCVFFINWNFVMLTNRVFSICSSLFCFTINTAYEMQSLRKEKKDSIQKWKISCFSLFLFRRLFVCSVRCGATSPFILVFSVYLSSLNSCCGCQTIEKQPGKLSVDWRIHNAVATSNNSSTIKPFTKWKNAANWKKVKYYC